MKTLQSMQRKQSKQTDRVDYLNVEEQSQPRTLYIHSGGPIMGQECGMNEPVGAALTPPGLVGMIQDLSSLQANNKAGNLKG